MHTLPGRPACSPSACTAQSNHRRCRLARGSWPSLTHGALPPCPAPLARLLQGSYSHLPPENILAAALGLVAFCAPQLLLGMARFPSAAHNIGTTAGCGARRRRRAGVAANAHIAASPLHLCPSRMHYRLLDCTASAVNNCCTSQALPPAPLAPPLRWRCLQCPERKFFFATPSIAMLHCRPTLLASINRRVLFIQSLEEGGVTGAQHMWTQHATQRTRSLENRALCKPKNQNVFPLHSVYAAGPQRRQDSRAHTVTWATRTQPGRQVQQQVRPPDCCKNAVRLRRIAVAGGHLHLAQVLGGVRSQLQLL